MYSKDLKAYIIKNNGVSVFNNSIKEYKTGFTLATDKSNYKTFKSIDTMLLYIYKTGIKNYGVWYDDEEKVYGIDTDIIRVSSKRQAFNLCKLYNEKAFFSWYSKKSVYV